MKQLEREHTRLDFDQRNRKIQRVDDERLRSVGRVDLAASVRPERRDSRFRSAMRVGRRRDLLGFHGSIVSGT